jgi:RNA-directed DNA polymerase
MIIEQITNRTNLNRAYLQVLQNKGAAGVDGMETHSLRQELHLKGNTYIQQLQEGCYQVSPILGVEIPKSNGKKRLLGIPTVVDRVIQQAIAQILQPNFEIGFQAHSYGFRPGRNAHQAVKQSLQYINKGYQHIVDIDLKSFFDEVQHGLLLELIYKRIKCPRTLKLIRSFLRAPIQINGKLQKRRKGLPQGSPLSPLLSNILLNELDKELEKRGLRYVRYADDFSIYVKSKAAARRVGNNIYRFLQDKLQLPINREKSGIRRPVNFKVLGYTFVPTYRKGEKGKYQLTIDKSKWKSLKAKLKSLTRKTTPISFDERMTLINQTLRGWINYFRMASIHQKLKTLEHWLRNRLRYCIWHHWKKPEKKRRSLIRLGVKPEMAYAWSRTRMGGWRVAQSPILGTTITLERLQKRGYIDWLNYYHQRKLL